MESDNVGSSMTWQAILKSWPEAAMIVARDGTILHANARAEALLSTPDAPLPGRHVDELVPASFRQRHAEHRAGYHDAPASRRMGSGADLVATRGDGTPFPAAIGLHPLEGTHEGEVLATIIDLTARERVEKLARTADEERSKLLQSMMAGIGHDLKNLLGVVLGNAVFLQEAGADAEAIADLLVASRQSVVLAEQLLDYSSARKDARTEVHLDALVRKARPLLRAMVPRAVQLEVHTQPVEAIRGRPRMLQQVLLNLVANAAEAMGSTGCITVRVTQEGDKAVLSVQDDGPGMSAEVLGRVFEPLFTTKPSGHGLGLAASQKTVRDHGGQLSAASVPGQGATFTVSLPIHSR